ncbi:hypothetical protein HDU87_000473 [Geranomyces variabilis]|uniref:AB hydrolase-1 domain-containing protein n=1 Tax=Geranomyces variabilis TaxID=109894 RepID=A0AAD5XLV2_9FUNG|nr:hypothetical protein HDU87_000473 [Geranomyces variabilis]
MDPSRYKDIVTSSGQTYHYYYRCAPAPAAGSKPITLLFVHGFPSTSFDWRHQVAHFEALGYGVIVPDQLGYGGSSKPTDVQPYLGREMAANHVDILNAERIDTAIAIGHDWGALVVSRLANYFPERFLAFAFIAASYMAPEPMDFEGLLAQTRQLLGYELLGYWKFFAEDGADKIIEQHANLLADKQVPFASYLSDNDRIKMRASLLKGGLKGPLNWYKSHVDGLAGEDNKQIPANAYTIDKPVFFAAASKDYVSLPDFQKPGLRKWCTKTTIKDYDADHWLLLSSHKALNADLEEWLKKTVQA